MVDSDPRTQLNVAEAPIIFCPETQIWCVMKQKAHNFFRFVAEKRDHTQENQKSFAKRSVLRKVFTPSALSVKRTSISILVLSFGESRLAKRKY